MKKIFILLLLIATLTVSAANNIRRIDAPDHLPASKGWTSLLYIELSNEQTVLAYRMHYRSDQWFKFESTKFLRDDKGRIYPIQRLDNEWGVGLDSMYFHKKGGEVIMRLVYPPLPDDVTWIDDTDLGDDGWGTYGIRLDGPLRPRQKEKPTTELPAIETEFGMAEIRGHILDFHEGMLKNVALYEALTYDGNLAATHVSPEGDFTFSVPLTHITPLKIMAGSFTLHLPMIYAEPGKRTEVYLNLKEMRSPSGCAPTAYITEGPLADIATEFNMYRYYDTLFDDVRVPEDTINSAQQLFDLCLEHIVNYRTRHDYTKDYDTDNMVFTGHRFSPVAQQIQEMNDQLGAFTLFNYVLLRSPELTPNGVQTLRLNAFNDPHQMLCPMFIHAMESLHNLPLLYPDYVDHEMSARQLNRQLHEYIPFDTLQLKQNIEALPVAYRQWLTQNNDELIDIVNGDYNREGYIIREDLPDVEPSQLFNAFCERYKGKTVFMTAWIPNERDGYQMAFINDVVIPLQKEFADEDIAWVTISNHSDNYNVTRHLISNIRGDHYILDNDTYMAMMQNFHDRGEMGFGYAVITRDGTFIERKRFYPDVDNNRDVVKRALQ